MDRKIICVPVSGRVKIGGKEVNICYKGLAICGLEVEV